MKCKTLVLGLDGANWELIKPWIEEGILPNIKKVIDEGVWANSMSYPPPTTQPNWKCYSTGKNPGKFGVYWWEQINKNRTGIIIPDSRSFKSKEIFDYIGESGQKVAVINMPTTFPPKAINGYIISGGPDSDSDNYTYPSGFQKKLEEKYNYQVFPKAIHKSDAWIEETLKLIETRFRVAENLLEDVDFLHLTIFYINIFQHAFYRGEPTRKGWQIIDSYLGKFLEKDLNIIIMSDHGCASIDTVFYINSWLEQEGYLHLKRNYFQWLCRFGINVNSLYRFAEKLKIKSALKSIISSKFYSQLPTEQGTVDKDAKSDRVDWYTSRVIASGQGPIYILKNNSDPVLQDQLIEKLEKVTSPYTGQRIAKNIYKKDDIYSGDHMDIAPDLVFEQGEGVHTEGGVGCPDIFKPSSINWEAENVLEGLFAAYGPDIKNGLKINNIKIVDIAPTILHLLDLEVPEDMDGRVLKEIFSEGTAPAEREIKYQKSLHDDDSSETRSEDEEASVRRRLQELGYL